MKDSQNEKKFIDIHETDSNKTGILGFVERMLRRYKDTTYMVFYLVILFVCLSCLSVSFFPLVFILNYLLNSFSSESILVSSFVISFGIGLGVFLFIPMLLISTVFFNWLNPFEIKAWKGNWYSVNGIPWFYHNALFYLVRYSILDFITPSPVAIWYLKAMGMKIGKGTLINTSNISDPCLLELGDYVTIGGSATLMAHYGQKGILILAPTVIKDRAMIGLKSSIFGGVVIEEGAVVSAHEVILPKSVVIKE